LVCYEGGYTTIEDDVMVGPGIGIGIFGPWHDVSGSTYGFTQTGIALWIASSFAQAPLVNYTPTVPDDWTDPDPTTVQEALDALANGKGSRDFPDFSEVGLALVAGVDVYVAWSGTAIAGGISVAPGIGNSKIAIRDGRVTAASIISSIGITIDVFVEVQAGGVGPFVKTTVAFALVVAAGTVTPVPFGVSVPFLATDVIRVGFTLAAGGPFAPRVNFSLEMAY
jgi:hypothetical protein